MSDQMKLPEVVFATQSLKPGIERLTGVIESRPHTIGRFYVESPDSDLKFQNLLIVRNDLETMLAQVSRAIEFVKVWR